MPEKRNIVLITLDSLRADHCSFMGYERETTPTIDRMARKGLYFENAIASSVPTGPSMFCVFTGDYCPIASEDFSIEKWRKELLRRKTLAEVLRNKGYDTGAIHPHPWTSAYFGFDKGFNYFENIIQEDHIENMTRGSRISSFILGLRKVISKEGSNLPWEKYYDKIINWIKNCKRPYFLWVFLVDTHTPYLPPERKWSRLGYWRLVYLFWRIERRNWSCKDKKEIEIVRDAYDDEIYYSDKFIKTLWNDLKDDDPIFIIHADHGDSLGEHGFYRHPPMLYEELLHVPLIIYNADIKGKIENPVPLLSLAPTILELTGEENEFPSKSIFHYNKEWVISQVIDGGRIKVAVRMKDWKFITGQREKDELYYLKKDPYEQENVVDEHPDLARELRKIAESHVKLVREKEIIRKKISSLKI